MPAQMNLPTKGGPCADSSEHPCLEDLLRPVIELLGKPNGHGGSSSLPDGEEVLLDAEVDGSRYLLVRLPSIAKSRVQLSPREQEIVRMVALGHPNKVIADVLSISSWTVCTHLRRVFAKFGVTSRAAVVARFLEIGAIGKTSTPFPESSASPHRSIKTSGRKSNLSSPASGQLRAI